MSADEPSARGAKGPPVSYLVWLSRKALSAAFDLLYHRLAPAYDAISWVVSGGKWSRWRRVALDYLPQGRVLEVGPGTGHLLLELLDSGRDAYGVERSPEMLRIAGARLASRGFEGRLVPGDGRSLPFDGAEFDALVLTFPAPFLDASFWHEAARVLRPGGRLVIVLGAESREWPWPGALEWMLGRISGAAWMAGEEVSLADGLVGRLIDRRVGRGVAHLIVAQKA